MLHATSLRIPVVEVEGGTLTAVAGFDGHQGIALVVAPRRWASPDEVLAQAAERGEPPLVLVLDSLEDPQNVGTLLRTAEATGAHGAVFPTRHQAPLTPAAVKASAGAVEHLRLAPVDDLPGALADLHARGLRIVGADGDAPLTARDADLRGPIAIVVGSEGKGLSSAVRRRCDLLVRIPMHGRIESLNAAVAGSILLYEAAAQRRLPEPARAPRDDSGDAEPDGDVPTALDELRPPRPADSRAPGGRHRTRPSGRYAERRDANRSRPDARGEGEEGQARGEAEEGQRPSRAAEATATAEPTPAAKPKPKPKAKPTKAKAQPAPEATATSDAPTAPPSEAPEKPKAPKRARSTKAAAAPEQRSGRPARRRRRPAPRRPAGGRSDASREPGRGLTRRASARIIRRLATS